jgi:hypothetical protein
MNFNDAIITIIAELRIINENQAREIISLREDNQRGNEKIKVLINKLEETQIELAELKEIKQNAC